MTLRRRAVLAGSLAGSLAAGAAAAAEPTISLPGQYGERLRSARHLAFHLHNQPADSTLHRALASLWSQVFERTGGDLLVRVLPLDGNLSFADAEAVFDVAAGRFGFVSVAAPILDRLVPDISLQSLPFVFRTVEQVMAMADRPAFVGLMQRGCAAANLAYLPGGTFSNGLRIIASTQAKPVRDLLDLQGLRLRTPLSADIALLFRTLGADVVAAPISEMRPDLANGTVDAEENPPAVIDNFGLRSVTHWINVTNHVWSGFNTLANLPFWRALRPETRDAVLQILPAVRADQVAAQEAVNTGILRPPAGSGGMEVVETDMSGWSQKAEPARAAMLRRFSPAARAIAASVLP